ncbi:MAG: fatty acid desaturase [Bdellovibrionaceae bacterium]|nr:fatty acid desaturase [Pseudobdellovibrionaceae bacterium]
MLSRDQIKELSKPNLWKWSVLLCIDWLLVGLIFYQARYFNNLFSYLAAIVLLGPVIHAIAILGHDGCHRRISNNQRLNDFLTSFLALGPVTMPLGLYRDFHFSHHRHLGTEKDGEIAFKKEFAPMWDLPIAKNYVYKTALLDFLGVNFMNMIRMSKGTGNAKPNDRLPMIAFWLIALSLIAWSRNWWMLLIWFSAVGSSFWAVFRFRLWCEHMGTAGTYRYQANFWHRLIFLPHNIDIHWEHHKYPSIPCWNLPRVRKLITEVPIIPLDEVFTRLEHSSPIPSGTVLPSSEFENTSRDFIDYDKAV